MSVADGNLATASTFNNAFMSRTGDTSTTGAITQSNTTQSTTKDTGAIVTEGGVGIEKNLNVGGTIKNADTTASTTKDTGAIVTEGGLGVEGNINAGGNITATGTMAASNLSGTNTGDVVLGNVGSAPNATGATLSGQNLNLEPADATNPGVVSTGAQSFAGDKTFVDDVIITGDLTVNGTTTTINTATLDVEDANILINNGGNDASAEGAGLTVERTSTNATILHENALASKFKCGAAGSESEIMTVGSAQTITGSKTITTPMTYEEEGSAPSTPSAGYRKLYAKADGFYSLNSSGAEEQLSFSAIASRDQSYEISNLTLTATVAANALTVALKTKAGSDPSAGSPVVVGFRNATSATGDYTQVSTTSALSVVVSSGSTLGTTSGQAFYLYIYGIYTGSAMVLGVQGLGPTIDEGSVVSTTAEGGAGAADLSGTIYTTSAQTNKPARLLGRILMTQATAGAWASGATEISLNPFSDIKSVNVRYTTAAAQSIPDSTNTIIDFGTKVFDAGNNVTTGASWKFTAPSNGTYSVSARVMFDSYAWGATTQKSNLSVWKNGSYYTNLSRQQLQAAVTTLLGHSASEADVKLLAGDYIDIRIDHDRGSATLLFNDALFNWVNIKRTGNY